MNKENEHIRLIGSVSEKLLGKGLFLGTAESCTGGLAAVWCTDMAGSSAWFKGGVVAYANAVKEALLGVDGALLAAHGAVSEQVVEAMALGALERLGVDVALATSGVAGPDGGTVEKPVGTVWMAVAARGKGTAPRVMSQVRHFPGERGEVRRAAARAAFAAVDTALAEWL